MHIWRALVKEQLLALRNSAGLCKQCRRPAHCCCSLCAVLSAVCCLLSAAASCCSELVEYKYVVLNGDGTVDRWQPGDNLKMEVPVAQVGGAAAGEWVQHEWVPWWSLGRNPQHRAGQGRA